MRIVIMKVVTNSPFGRGNKIGSPGTIKTGTGTFASGGNLSTPGLTDTGSRSVYSSKSSHSRKRTSLLGGEALWKSCNFS
jgi:hypothetical protein